MNYVGVDVHKKYSVLCALHERGRKLREGRVEGNADHSGAAITIPRNCAARDVPGREQDSGLLSRKCSPVELY